RASHHVLVLGLPVLLAADRDQLDLLELVLADEAAGVFPRRARFAAKTGGEGGQPDWLREIVDDLLAHRIGQADLGSGDEPAVTRGINPIDNPYCVTECLVLQDGNLLEGFSIYFFIWPTNFRLEKVLGELRQLPRAEHRLVPHEQRRRAFAVAIP